MLPSPASDRALSMGHKRGVGALFAALVPLLSSLAGMARARRRRNGQTGPSIRLSVQKLSRSRIIIVVLLATIAWADLRASEAIGGFALPLGLGLARPGPDGQRVRAGEPVLAARHVSAAADPDVPRRVAPRSPSQRASPGSTRNDDLRVHESEGRAAAARDQHDAERRVVDARRPARDAGAVVHVHAAARRQPRPGLPSRGRVRLGRRRRRARASRSAWRSPSRARRPARRWGCIRPSRARSCSRSPTRGSGCGSATRRASSDVAEHRTAARRRAELLRELLGLTTDHNPYVYLSDGGHYENLGLWEMVARRCRFIIVSDAGCDPSYTFDDLANAVRRIRPRPRHPDPVRPSLDITKAGQGTTQPARGDRPHPLLRGRRRRRARRDDPVSRRRRCRATSRSTCATSPSGDPTFPHDSTANQFFDEARFESYRTLGYHSVLSIAGGMRNLTSASRARPTPPTWRWRRHRLRWINASSRLAATITADT